MKLVVSTVLLACSISTWANIKTTAQGIKYPASHTFISDKENTRIISECQELNNGNIKCTFNQIMIIRESLDVAEKELIQMKSGKKDKEIISALEILKKEACITVNNSGKLNNSMPNEETIRIIHLLKNLCANPTMENYIKFIETSFEEKKQTCKIFDKTYTETFKYDFQIDKWVSQTQPYSSCGFINISYLEKDPRRGFDKFSWNYIYRKIITNKNGTILGQQCSQLAQDENSVINYGLGSLNYEKNKQLNCKYINLPDRI